MWSLELEPNSRKNGFYREVVSRCCTCRGVTQHQSRSDLTVDLGIKVSVSKHHETMIQGVFRLLSMYMSLHVCHKHQMWHSSKPCGCKRKICESPAELDSPCTICINWHSLHDIFWHYKALFHNCCWSKKIKSFMGVVSILLLGTLQHVEKVVMELSILLNTSSAFLRLNGSQNRFHCGIAFLLSHICIFLSRSVKGFWVDFRITLPRNLYWIRGGW